eukprot:jgi/Botrbrau1/14126/Bobra.182_3s0069.1
MWKVPVFVILFVICTIHTMPAQAQWPDDESVEEDGIPTGPNAACYCSDVSPRNDNNTVDYNCQQQLELGNCNANFMRETVKEVPEGYCQITCSRCNCCSTLSDLLQKNGLTSIVDAARAAGLGPQLDAPATMLTLLAPTNEAFNAAVTQLGAPSLSGLASSNPSLLSSILSYHILPPVPVLNATWTSPFFAAAPNPIPTALPGASVLVSAAPGGTYTIRGATNAATIVKADLEACKAVVEVIDTVLLPPGAAQVGQSAAGR